MCIKWCLLYIHWASVVCILPNILCTPRKNWKEKKLEKKVGGGGGTRRIPGEKVPHKVLVNTLQVNNSNVNQTNTLTLFLKESTFTVFNSTRTTSLGPSGLSSEKGMLSSEELMKVCFNMIIFTPTNLLWCTNVISMWLCLFVVHVTSLVWGFVFWLTVHMFCELYRQLI